MGAESAFDLALVAEGAIARGSRVRAKAGVVEHSVPERVVGKEGTIVGGTSGFREVRFDGESHSRHTSDEHLELVSQAAAPAASTPAPAGGLFGAAPAPFATAAPAPAAGGLFGAATATPATSLPASGLFGATPATTFPASGGFAFGAAERADAMRASEFAGLPQPLAQTPMIQ